MSLRILTLIGVLLVVLLAAGCSTEVTLEEIEADLVEDTERITPPLPLYELDVRHSEDDDMFDVQLAAYPNFPPRPRGEEPLEVTDTFIRGYLLGMTGGIIFRYNEVAGEHIGNMSFLWLNPVTNDVLIYIVMTREQWQTHDSWSEPGEEYHLEIPDIAEVYEDVLGPEHVDDILSVVE